MALQSSRKGLRKEQVDYLGNIIIDEHLKQDIVNSVNDVFASKSDVLTYEEIQASTNLSGKITSASALKDYDNRRYIFKHYGDDEVNSLGGFQEAFKNFVRNYILDGLCYVGRVVIGNSFLFIGGTYVNGTYGGFLLIGPSDFYLIQIRSNVWYFREL